jgi:hypothetical protein
MSRITQAQHERQLAVFKEIDLSQPMTVSQVRRAMSKELGYMPGESWTKARMRERGKLLSRLEALELVRCPIHKILMNSDCAACAGRIERCLACNRWKMADEPCESCGKKGEKDA